MNRQDTHKWTFLSGDDQNEGHAKSQKLDHRKQVIFTH